MKAFIARYICDYDEVDPLSSVEIVRTDKTQLINELLSKKYHINEIDINTEQYEYGWEINEIEIV